MTTDVSLNASLNDARQSALAELAARTRDSPPDKLDSTLRSEAVAELLDLLGTRGRVMCEVNVSRSPSAPPELP